MTSVKFLGLAFLAVAWLLLVAPSVVHAQSSGVIGDVVVEGAQRIDPETVRSYMVVQPGDAFDAKRIDRSLKSLFATGLFADVAIRRQGNALIVSVVENPIINRVAFEGNDRVDDDTLNSEVSLRPRVIYTRTKVQNDVQRILSIYRASGRFSATVEPKVIRLEQNRVDLAFEISEGPLTEIRNIRFVGNREYSDSRLHDAIRTKESRWWRFLNSDDVYDPDRLTLDRELLRSFYLSEGYADFRVRSAIAELTPDRRDFFITFMVDEGSQYTFGGVTVEANLRGVDAEVLKSEIEIEVGEVYDADIIDETVQQLTTEVGNAGYAFVNVRPRVDRDREAKTIDVSFEVSEGPRVFVEWIDIVGNVRTEDKVLRREFLLVEGDAFNSSKLRRSRQALRDLGFFENVVVERVPGSTPDKTVLNVEVQEKSTGSFSIGAGFSTDSGALADVGFQESNLLGRGQQFQLRALIAQKDSQINFSVTEPYFLDRKVSAGFDLYRSNNDNQDTSSFNLSRTGGALRFGFLLSDDVRQTWRYSLEDRSIEDVDSGASLFVQQQAGSTLISQVSHSVIWDKRDSTLNPTEGFSIRLANDFAGLGGDVSFLRNQISGAQYYSFADRWILSLKGSVGYIFGLDEDIRIVDRFFLGGSNLRGFASSGAGPRDSSTSDSLGGDWHYTSTAELNFPLGLPSEVGLTAKTFVDVGSLGGVSPSTATVQDTGALRMSAGAGLVWSSPLGPIGMDFAIPIVKEDFDNSENIRISFGTNF